MRYNGVMDSVGGVMSDNSGGGMDSVVNEIASRHSPHSLDDG